MDEFATVDPREGNPVPEHLKALFENADEVGIQPLPCALSGLVAKAVHFAPGARTLPHRHAHGQQIVVTNGIGVVADRNGVRIVRAGDVIANPATEWHWHGALPGTAMSHVTLEDPGLDLDVPLGDWEQAYPPDLGGHPTSTIRPNRLGKPE